MQLQMESIAFSDGRHKLVVQLKQNDGKTLTFDVETVNPVQTGALMDIFQSFTESKQAIQWTEEETEKHEYEIGSGTVRTWEQCIEESYGKGAYGASKDYAIRGLAAKEKHIEHIEARNSEQVAVIQAGRDVIDSLKRQLKELVGTL